MPIRITECSTNVYSAVQSHLESQDWTGYELFEHLVNQRLNDEDSSFHVFKMIEVNGQQIPVYRYLGELGCVHAQTFVSVDYRALTEGEGFG
jgi:hypothetical protein